MAKKKTINDDDIIIALLTCGTIKAAANSVGISDRTIYSRLAKPEFKARYDAERRKMFDAAAAALQAHITSAIDTMGEIVNDTEANPQTRLNAAEGIIRNTLKMTERADVLDRLDALERRLE